MEDTDAKITFLMRQSEKHEQAIGELSRIMALQAIRASEQYEKTQEQFRITDARLREIDERLSQRIEKLVSAIGVMTTRLPAPSA